MKYMVGRRNSNIAFYDLNSNDHVWLQLAPAGMTSSIGPPLRSGQTIKKQTLYSMHSSFQTSPSGTTANSESQQHHVRSHVCAQTGARHLVGRAPHSMHHLRQAASPEHISGFHMLNADQS